MLTRAQKESQVAELKEKFSRATSVFLADYRGVSVEDINELRQKIRAVDGEQPEYRVAKNSILKLATADSEMSSLEPHLTGPTSIAISYGDPVGLAKMLVDYQKAHEVFELKGGYLDGKALDTAEIATLATLPSLDQLRGTLVGLLQAPATKLVRLLLEPGGQIARLMEARKSSLGEAGGA